MDVHDRIPPQDLEAEMCVLGAMVRDGSCIGEVASRLDAGDFYGGRNGIIFMAIGELWHKRVPVDLVTLADALRAAGRLGEAGGVGYLTEIADATPSAANVEAHAEIVADKALLRRLIQVYTGGLNRVFENGRTAHELLDAASADIFAVGRARRAESVSTAAEMMSGLMSALDDPAKAGRSTPTGFRTLDEVLSGGLTPGSLTLVAGRTSMGKSALALQVAKNVAQTRRRVLLFSIESPSELVSVRLLSLDSGVPAERLQAALNGRRLMDADTGRVTESIARVAALPLTVDDTPGLRPMQALARARNEKLQRGLDLVVIDHLHEMQSDAKCQSALEKYSDIGRAVKVLARELDCPVLAAAQLNRQADGRDGNEPHLSDLSQSGVIEQVADVALMLYRPGYYAGNGDPTARLFVRKNRNGPCGPVELTFDAPTMTFREASA